MSASADRVRVQRAAMRIGVLVGLASALIIAGGVVTLVLLLLTSGRPEGHHGDARPDADPDGDRFVVDVDHVLPWVVVLGVVGVLLLAFVAWFAARRAVRPLADALQTQRTFVADASHEIRTPLTALTSRIQIVQRRLDRGEDARPAVAELRRDAAVLDEVLTDMLLAAEGQHTGEPAEVGAAVDAAVATVRPLADDADVHLAVAIPAPARVTLAPVTLTRLLVALLDNAVQHAPRGSSVSLDVEEGTRDVTFRVRDAGSGVADEDRERIFERFARSGEVGRRRGFGLGLALVREAATAAGGSVRIEETSPRGTTFALTVPRA